MKKEERDRMARAMARPAVVVGRAEAQAPVPEPVPVREKVVATERIKCAYCGNKNSKVMRTIGHIRYRRCVGGCGRNFIEKGVSMKLRDDR